MRGAGLAGIILGNYIPQVKCESNNKLENKNNVIAVYFTTESKRILNDYLTKKGISNPDVKFVCLHRSASLDTIRTYEPIFGSRVAFRFKTIIKLDEGRVVGTGRISSMVGEILEDDFTPSIPIISNTAKAKQEEISTLSSLLDVPSRITLSMKEKPLVIVRIPGGSVLNTNYPPLKVTVINLPITEQIVVDGYICTDSHIDDNGICHYDPKDDATTTITPQKTETSSINNASEAIEDPSECPICRYMKLGPCKNEFIVWDECIKNISEDEELQKCFSDTSAMMMCMKNVEYYDIMTAGLDYSKFNIARPSATKKIDISS